MMVADTDLLAARVWEKGRYYEDFTVGDVYDHHWGRTLNAGDNSSFCTATAAWLPLYLNAAYARSLGHPDLVVHPMLVFCTVLGLTVEDLSEGGGGGAFLRVTELHSRSPVYPGMTLTARSEVLEQRPSRSRPDQAILTWRTTGFADDGVVVVDFRRTNLVRRRQDERSDR
ncbi:MAG TPA: MaoC family dehydratase [Tepidiformaceae bacterium]